MYNCILIEEANIPFSINSFLQEIRLSRISNWSIPSEFSRLFNCCSIPGLSLPFPSLSLSSLLSHHFESRLSHTTKSSVYYGSQKRKRISKETRKQKGIPLLFNLLVWLSLFSHSSFSHFDVFIIDEGSDIFLYFPF